MKWLFVVLLVISFVGCTEESSRNGSSKMAPTKTPWAGRAPRRYETSDETIIKKAYEEKYQALNDGEERTRFIDRAKQVVREWGQNPDGLEIEGRWTPRRAVVSVSEHFVWVIFLQTEDATMTCLQVAVLLEKGDGRVLSLEFGS
jgi:hypothetical protein